jgi:hypothetical protein
MHPVQRIIMMENSAVTPRAGSRRSAVVVSLVLVAAAFLALRALAPPKPLPADAPAGEFSAERAFRWLKEIAAEPHPTGTAAHADVRDAILRFWRELGFEPEVQAGTHLEPEDHFAARVENILARLPGTRPTPGGALLLASHYDSVESAPGASDAGSGVVALLETARALKAGPPLAEDVIFLITDAEEDGLIGARVFKDAHPWAGDVGLALNLESRGTSGPSLMFETSVGNEHLIEALADARHPRAFSFSASVYRSMPNSTDLSIWLNLRIQGMNFAFIGRPYDYHTSGDSLSHFDLRSLQHHGSLALDLVRRFGSGGVPPRTRRDAVYFSLFGDILVHYSTTTAFLLAGLVAALVFAAGRLWASGRRLRLSGLVRGAVLMAAAAAVLAGSGYGLIALVGSAHGSWLPAGPWRYSAGYFLALVLLAASVTTLLYRVLKAREAAFETGLGASLLWTLVTVATTIAVPDASYLTAWPSLFLSMALFLWALLGRGRDGEAPPLWIAALGGAGTALIAAPFLAMFFAAMSLTPFMAAVQAAVVSVLLAAVIPAIAVLERGLGRKLPVFSAALFLIVLVVSTLTAGYSERIPRAASFQYVMDFDAGRAYWMIEAGRPADPWTEGIAGQGPVVENPQPESFRGRYTFRAAPPATEPPPEVKVLEDRVSGSSRFVKLRIVSPRGGRRLSVGCDTEGLRAAALEGRALALAARNVKGVAAAVLNPGPDGFAFELETDAAAAVRVTVREYNPGFPAVPGFAPPPPPPGIRAHRIGVHMTKSCVLPPPGVPGGY